MYVRDKGEWCCETAWEKLRCAAACWRLEDYWSRRSAWVQI